MKIVKTSKITIKHYLNKRLKPEIFDGTSYYRVYVRVTVNRFGTTMPSSISYLFSTERALLMDAELQMKDECLNLKNMIKEELIKNPLYRFRKNH